MFFAFISATVALRAPVVLLAFHSIYIKKNRSHPFPLTNSLRFPRATMKLNYIATISYPRLPSLPLLVYASLFALHFPLLFQNPNRNRSTLCSADKKYALLSSIAAVLRLPLNSRIYLSRSC